jgi:signal transduction histidine kinase
VVPDEPAPRCERPHAPARTASDTTPDGDTLLRSDRLAGLGTLVAGVAHELNNPITYVLGNLDALERTAAALEDALAGHRRALANALGAAAEPLCRQIEEKLARAGGAASLAELLAETRQGAERIRDTVRELLAFARPDAGATDVRREPIAIHELLEFNLRMLKPELARSAVLVREYGARGAPTGRRAAIGQVLLNLLRNAIQSCAAEAAPERARITVRTRDCAGGVAIEVPGSRRRCARACSSPSSRRDPVRAADWVCT